jgi:NifU-like protein involved in Fe-S cluster formation
MSDLQQRISDAVSNPRNLGEMIDADVVGTAGSEGCGDMLRMWVKFREDAEGRKVIDRATFQTFGCETAIAVASVATELLAGKTVTQALEMSGEDLASPLGALPPMKIHCAQLVEGALRSALQPELQPKAPAAPLDSGAATSVPAPSPSLRDSFRPSAATERKAQIVFKSTPGTSQS